MKLRIRKRGGWWKTYLVYYPKTEYEYEVFLDKYSEFKDAILVASFISSVGMVES